MHMVAAMEIRRVCLGFIAFLSLCYSFVGAACFVNGQPTTVVCPPRDCIFLPVGIGDELTIVANKYTATEEACCGHDPVELGGEEILAHYGFAVAAIDPSDRASEWYWEQLPENRCTCTRHVLMPVDVGGGSPIIKSITGTVHRRTPGTYSVTVVFEDIITNCAQSRDPDKSITLNVVITSPSGGNWCPPPPLPASHSVPVSYCDTTILGDSYYYSGTQTYTYGHDVYAVVPAGCGAKVIVNTTFIVGVNLLTSFKGAFYGVESSIQGGLNATLMVSHSHEYAAEPCKKLRPTLFHRVSCVTFSGTRAYYDFPGCIGLSLAMPYMESEKFYTAAMNWEICKSTDGNYPVNPGTFKCN